MHHWVVRGGGRPLKIVLEKKQTVPVDTVDTVETVETVETVDTVDTVETVESV